MADSWALEEAALFDGCGVCLEEAHLYRLTAHDGGGAYTCLPKDAQWSLFSCFAVSAEFVRCFKGMRNDGISGIKLDTLQHQLSPAPHLRRGLPLQQKNFKKERQVSVRTSGRQTIGNSTTGCTVFPDFFATVITSSLQQESFQGDRIQSVTSGW